MKKIVIIGVSMLLFSCSKDPTGINSRVPAPPPSLSSVQLLSTGFAIKDSFEYDTTHQVVRLLQYEFDSTGPGSPVADSEIVVFGFTGNSVLPTSYAFTQHAVTRTHQLSYNTQNRVIKDTCSATHYVARYTYPGDNIVTTVLSNGTIHSEQIDTLFFNNNSNVNAINFYISNSASTNDSLLDGHGFGFSTYANPAYYAPIANTVGPLLFSLIQDYDNYGDGSITDFFSRNAINGVSFYNTVNQATVYSPLTVIANSAGKVVLVTYFADDQQRLVYRYYH